MESKKSVRKVKKTCDHNRCAAERTVGVFCDKHQADADAVGSVMKLTELEALKWAKLDTEIRNALQGLRLADLEVEKAKREFVEFRNLKELEKSRLQSTIETLKPEYTNLVEGFGKKYGIDPTKMSIDPDTRVIRDLSDKKQETGSRP